MKDLASSTPVKFGTDALLAEAVKRENAGGQTLSEIEEVQESAATFAEIFVMNRMGANVAMTGKTSDYWQGDEAQFTESFKKGKKRYECSQEFKRQCKTRFWLLSDDPFDAIHRHNGILERQTYQYPPGCNLPEAVAQHGLSAAGGP